MRQFNKTRVIQFLLILIPVLPLSVVILFCTVSFESVFFANPPFVLSSSPYVSFNTILEEWESVRELRDSLPSDFGHNTTEIRKELIQRYGTNYGCDSDPIIAAARDKTPKNVPWPLDKSEIPYNAQPKEPPKIALLFMITESLKLPRVWTHWFEDARQWSRSQLDLGIGPYANLTTTDDSPLFTVYTHDGGVWDQEDERITVPYTTFSTSLIEELRNSLVPTVDNTWGSINWVEHQLLHDAMKDERNSAFILVSDFTIPVKPFRFIYEEFQANPRSRFFFSNVNLPLIRKHDTWIVVRSSFSAPSATPAVLKTNVFFPSL